MSESGRHDRPDLRGLLARRAAEDAAVPAAFDLDGHHWTYEQLNTKADELAARIPEGRFRVAIRVTNTPIALAAVHACWRSHCTPVLVPSSIGATELTRRVRDTRCSFSIDTRDVAFDDEVVLVDEPDGDAVTDEDEALIIFTSGTSGRPKGAVIGFDALASSIHSIGAALGMPAGRRPTSPPRSPSLTIMTLAHVSGFLSTVTALFLGSPTLLAQRWEPDQIFAIAERFNLGSLRLAPAMVHDLAHAPPECTLPTVKSISVGSAPLSEKLRAQVEQRYDVVLLNAYGQTELSGAIAFERYQDVKAGRRPAGSVGRIADGMKVRIADDEDQELPLGDIGEIQVQSSGALKSYISDGDLQDPREDGWIKTGDLGSLDSDGFLFLRGRIRDVIITGGYNVYPVAVETSLLRVAGVAEALVTSIPDDRLGEVVVAVVSTEPGVELESNDVVRRLRDEVATYELPRVLKIVERIPLAASGKPDREAVKQLVLDQETLPS